MRIAQTGRAGRGFAWLYRAAAVLLAGFGLTMAFTAPAAAAAPSDAPTGTYCTGHKPKPGCLAPLTGRVKYLGCGAESQGGDVDIVVRNPNRTAAPRDIAVFVKRGGEYVEIFGDRDWAEAGRNVTSYRGLPNGTYRLTVGWADQGLTFFGKRFTVNCEGGNDPSLPPPEA